MIYKKGGFTLMELVLGVGIVAMLASAGTAIFSRTLRGTSQLDTRRVLDDRVRVITNGLSRFLQEGRAISLSQAGTTQTREDCLTAGQVSGDILTVRSLDDEDSIFSVDDDGILSSASASVIQINPESVSISLQSGLDYYFIWNCDNGVPDRIKMLFSATVVGSEGESDLSSDYTVDVVMRNSGQ